MKNISILFIGKEKRCGCSDCFNICPNNAITMKEDDE